MPNLPLVNPSRNFQENVQMPQTQPVRQLDFGTNTPTPSPQGQAPTDQAGTFNNALLGLLTKYQQLGTKPFVQQGQDAQTAQNNRILATTPQSLVGAAPGVQNSVRSASADALSPTIQGAQNSAQTYSEQLRSFGDAVTTARQFMADTQASSDRARDDARAVIKDALTLGGADSLKGLTPEEITKLEKSAGYPAGYVHGLAQTIKERELELKKQADADRSLQKSILSEYQQTQVFDNIVAKQNSSPLIKASERTPVLKDAIAKVKQNPTNGALQLNLVYSYVQALDTYQSAVREGELGLVGSIDSKVGQLQNYVQKIQNGQIVRPDVALQIAAAADNILNTINSAAAQKAKSFQSQADVAGIGDKYRQYTAGYSSTYGDNSGGNNPLGI